MSNKPFAINIDNKATIPESKRNAGFSATQEPHEYFNEALFNAVTDHIWGTSGQVVGNEATFYTDGSGNPLDKNAASVTINDDDKILIRHNVAQTANLLLNAGGKKVTIEMYDDVTLDMSTFDLTLGSTGDQIAGSIRVSGTGDLQIQESSGFRIEHDSMTISNLAGDIVVNNSDPAVSSANIDAKDLKIEYTSASTVTVTADSLKLVSDDNQSVVVNTIDETPDISVVGQRQNGASELSDAIYNIWLGATSTGAIETKYLPVLSATADGTTTNELVDSSENFTTHLAAIGDKVFNDTDGTFAFVTSVANSASGRLLLNDDIFVSGEDYTIELRSPTFSAGYSFHANVGSVENVSGNFVESSVFKKVPETIRITDAFWHTAAGFGSTDTRVPYFTNEVIQSNDTVVTVENDSTNGFRVTANMDCKVNFHGVGNFAGSSYIGISLNSTQLTTNINTINADDRLCINLTPGSGVPRPVSTTVNLEKGEVLRLHTDSATVGTAAQMSVVVFAEEIK